MIAAPTGRGRPICGWACICKPGPGVDFDDHAPLRLQGPADVRGHQVDSGHIQSDHAGGQHGQRGGVGMELIGHVGRVFAVVCMITRAAAAGIESAV